ncbi:MAG: AIR synthase family protein [Candidatus Thorarchaeota archaeon]
MLPGKIPPDILERLVFTHLGRNDPDLILGPGIGQDASLIRIGNRVIVASTDPITGSIEDIGWLAVHVNANDVATFGVAPKWFLTSIMLPVGSTAAEVGRIMSQIDSAAKTLGITVAGGHTEITEGIEKPIVAGFMLGETSEGDYVTSSGAQPGNAIVMTKTVGIEGTAILAAEGREVLSKELDVTLLDEALALRSQISVVSEGLSAFKTGHLTAMHDPTEGGLAGGLHELCDASGVGFEVELNRIPIHHTTKLLCNAIGVNVLELISSGCMLMTCDSNHVDDVIAAIESKNVQATILGCIIQDEEKRLIYSEGAAVQLARPSTDALWSALKKVNPQGML